MTVVLSFYLLTALKTLSFLSSHVERSAKLIPILVVESHIAS